MIENVEREKGHLWEESKKVKFGIRQPSLSVGTGRDSTNVGGLVDPRGRDGTARM